MAFTDKPAGGHGASAPLCTQPNCPACSKIERWEIVFDDPMLAPFPDAFTTKARAEAQLAACRFLAALAGVVAVGTVRRVADPSTKAQAAEAGKAGPLPTRGDLETVLLAVLDETDVPLGDEHAHALAEAVGEYHLTSADGIGRPLGFAEAVAGAARLIRGDDAGDGLDALAIVTAERDALRAQLRAALADVEQARRDEVNADAITKARIEDVARLEAEVGALKESVAKAAMAFSHLSDLQSVRYAGAFGPAKVGEGEG